MENNLIGKFYINPTFDSYYEIFIIHAWSEIMNKYIVTRITDIDKPVREEYLKILDDSDLETVMNHSELKKFIQYEKEKFASLSDAGNELLAAYKKEMGRHHAMYTKKEIRNGIAMKRAIKKVLEVYKQVQVYDGLIKRFPKDKVYKHEYQKTFKGYKRVMKPIYSKLSPENMETFLERLKEVTDPINYKESDPEFFFEPALLKMLNKAEATLDKFAEKYRGFFK